MVKLNLEKEKKLLVKTIISLKSPVALNHFLEDLLTEEEILDLSQRLKIAKLIIDGKTYDEIAEKVGASTSTISKIGQVIKYGKGGFQKAN